MLAPAAVPKPVLASLSAAVHRVLAMADVGEKLSAQGVEISPSNPTERAALIDRELAKRTKVIKASGVKLN